MVMKNYSKFLGIFRALIVQFFMSRGSFWTFNAFFSCLFYNFVSLITTFYNDYYYYVLWIFLGSFSCFCFSRWVDGGFNTLVRSYAHNDQSGSDSHSDPTRFLVMDGNINERQMEIFGSVLHSSGKLTFANNESFELAGNIKIFWEVSVCLNWCLSFFSYQVFRKKKLIKGFAFTEDIPKKFCEFLNRQIF